MIELAAHQDAEDIQRLVDRVVALSVDATRREKRDICAHTRSNHQQWLLGQRQILHLKYTQNCQIMGVVLVKDYWNLCHLFVEPSLHGLGTGRALLEAAIASCRANATRDSMKVNSSRNAVSFYRRLGFVEVPGANAELAAMQLEFRFRP